MRIVEAKMIQAIRHGLNDCIIDGRIMRSGNTEVRQEHHGIAHTRDYHRTIQVLLHGSTIATVEPDLMRITLDDCGYRTVTTKSRLNALLRAFVPGEGITQQDFTWYTSEGLWDGSDEWPIKLTADNYVLRQAEKLAP